MLNQMCISFLWIVGLQFSPQKREKESTKLIYITQLFSILQFTFHFLAVLSHWMSKSSANLINRSHIHDHSVTVSFLTFTQRQPSGLFLTQRKGLSAVAHVPQHDKKPEAESWMWRSVNNKPSQWQWEVLPRLFSFPSTLSLFPDGTVGHSCGTRLHCFSFFCLF